ncbi:MAG: hypothetical protein F6K55_06120 [Moorea sp. SIO4A3]|nr:hypothetical protein [Moorena sp. SIO4A3]
MTTYPFAVYDEKATELKAGVNVNLNGTDLVLSPLILWSKVGNEPVVKDLRANIYFGSSFKPVLEPVKGEAEDNLTVSIKELEKGTEYRCVTYLKVSLAGNADEANDKAYFMLFSLEFPS